jgi:hypothetical protein
MKPYKPIKVYRWYSKDKYDTYIFDKTGHQYTNGELIIEQNIYLDDNIDDAINKIALYIINNKKEPTSLYYCWTNKKSISHSFKNIKWSGFNINPFLSVNRTSKEINEGISYIFNTNTIFENVSNTVINIVFNNDLNNDLINNKYYFIDKKIPSLNNYKIRDNKLYDLVIQETKYLKKYNDKFNRVDFYTKLKKDISLSQIFDKIRTKHNIALIQWINDTSNILYKIQKKHFIKKEQLLNWCSIDKITKINCINIYYIIATSCYCKIRITANGDILLSYILDIRKNIGWDIILKTKQLLTDYLNKYIKEKLKFKEESLKLNTSFMIDNTTFNNFVGKITKAIDIFSIKPIIKTKNQVICIYKRSEKYNDNLDINQYIISRYNLGVTKNEIVNELINLGYTSSEANNEVDNIIDNINNVNENELTINKLKENGTIIIINKANQGFDIELINSANYNELNYLYYWLSKIISSSRSVDKKVKKDNIKVIESINYDDYNLDNINDPEDDNDKLGELTFDLDDDDDELLGGGLGKDKHSYFVDLIKKVDKDLVTENYARDKCQSEFQPVVLTKEEKEELEKNNNTHYDNILEYGSDKNKMNFYICPKLWCPISKIPLDVNSEKYECPLENEEPMKLFWGKDKKKERYIKLIKPNEKGLCSPCCGKKKQKDAELAKCKLINTTENVNNKSDNSIQPDDKENNYLMNQKAPIESNRYGSIPELLHNILLTNVSYDLCSKMLNKTQKCFIRKGINHKNNNKNIINKSDSIIYAITELLNFKTKSQFINDIKDKLDLLTFISLENGEICKAFMNTSEIIPDNHIKILYKLQKNHKLLSLYKYDKTNKISISRIINIYNSYNKFINYLSSNDYPDDKTAYYLYTLISVLYNKLLIVWEYDNDIKIKCPLFTSYSELLTGLDLEPELIMLLKDKSYYEPIILKSKVEENKNNIKLSKYPYIKNIITECSKYNKDYKEIYNIFNDVYTLNQWTASKSDKYYIFNITTILINNDLTISYALTESNILIGFQKISIYLLSKFLKDFNIKQVKFYDDLVNTKLEIKRINKDIYKKFTDKCDSLNIKYYLDEYNIIENTNLFNANLVLKNINLNNNTIIYNNYKNAFYDYLNKEKQVSYKWYNLQKLVADILTKNYDNEKFIKEFKDFKREKIINTLYNKYFTKYNNSNTIKIILEELPINTMEPITNISKWINNILIYYKYNFMSNLIKEKQNQLIFSQNVFYIDNKFDIPYILLNYHDYMPNNYNLVYNESNKDFIIDKNTQIIKYTLPDYYKGTIEQLPTKWRTRTKEKWSNYVIIKNNYSLDLFKDLINWISHYLNIKINYEEIKEIVNNYYLKSIYDKNVANIIFNDPSFYNAWANIINIKQKNVAYFMKNNYSKYTKEQLNTILNKVLENDNVLYPNDITIKVLADIFNISILLIHRLPHGVGQEQQYNRNNIDEFLLSSTFIKSTKNMDNRPLFMFNKVIDSEYIKYYPIIENTEKLDINSIYIPMFKDAPDNIIKLVNKHIK